VGKPVDNRSNAAPKRPHARRCVALPALGAAGRFGRTDVVRTTSVLDFPFALLSSTAASKAVDLRASPISAVTIRGPRPAPATLLSHGIDGEPPVRTLARSVYLDSEFGTPQELPRAGSSLENPYVFDDAAREFKAMAQQGLVEILSEQRAVVSPQETLIARLMFKRLR